MAAVEFTHKQAVDPLAGYDVSKLKGKSAIITGGASGIGEAVLRAFVSAGAFVTFGDINEKRSAEIVAELGQDKVAFIRCDTTSWADQLALFKHAIASSPSHGVDIVLANAGMVTVSDDVIRGQTDPATDDPLEPDLKTMQINTTGYLYTARLATHYFPRQPEGEGRDRCLLMTASVAGYSDFPTSPQYGCSKFSVRGLMLSLRNTLPAMKARVNLLAPWFIQTPFIPLVMQQRLVDQGTQFTAVEDVAAAALHLACDTTLNGRALAALPRTYPNNTKGYVDIKLDDVEEGGFVHSLMPLVSSTAAAAAKK